MHLMSFENKMIKMESQTLLVLLVAGPVIIAIIMYFFHRMKMMESAQQTSMLQESNTLMQEELHRNRDRLQDFQEQNLDYQNQIIQLKTELSHARNRLTEELQNEEKQAQRFENIAHNILRSQTQVIHERQSKGMRDILEPLKERIQLFEAKVDASNRQSLERHISLKEQIHLLSKQSEQVSQDANNLAKALKGDFKMQGNWGEIILNSILEKSGLEKNREYFVQKSSRNGDGKLLRPDVVIHLPDEKRLVIDSKVSLVAYDCMVSAIDQTKQRKYQKAHVQAVRNHVNALSAKNYHDLYKMRSPDFVMMFVPIDTALSAALYEDPKLYDEAFHKNIIIVTSSTLLATLKTVETLWRNEKQNRHALKIAEEAGKMYDKFVGYVEDMEKLGAQLSTVQKTYDSSMKKLSEGSGNLLKKAELVRSLGAKANKQLPQNLLS